MFSEKNDEYIFLYLEIFFNFINSLPECLNGSITCIDNEINNIFSNYDNILCKIENIKSNFNNIINDLYTNNIKLKEVINNSLFIKTDDNFNLNIDTIPCDDVIKIIIKDIIKDFKPQDISLNSEKILLIFKKNIQLLINYKKIKQVTIHINNIDNNVIKKVTNDIFDLMDDINIEINKNQLKLEFDYKSNRIINITSLIKSII